jgi:hypothetical protein
VLPVLSSIKLLVSSHLIVLLKQDVIIGLRIMGPAPVNQLQSFFEPGPMYISIAGCHLPQSGDQLKASYAIVAASCQASRTSFFCCASQLLKAGVTGDCTVGGPLAVSGKELMVGVGGSRKASRSTAQSLTPPKLPVAINQVRAALLLGSI